MQDIRRHLSLNGVRAFEASARLRSLKAASAELGVTPSAISHQVRQLEIALGARLFARRHNAVELTPEGARFFADVGPAIQNIDRAGKALQRDASEVVVRVSQSIGIRWLIPRLHDFRASHPRLRVRVETANPPNLLGPGIDVAISYARTGQAPPEALHLLADRCVPVRAAALAASRANDLRTGSVMPFPIISATTDYWDWRSYCEAAGLDFASLRIVDQFDTDHAALEACLGGLGVCIATLAMIQPELDSGALLRLDRFPIVTVGDYWILAAHPRRHAAELFIAWLQKQAAATGG